MDAGVDDFQMTNSNEIIADNNVEPSPSPSPPPPSPLPQRLSPESIGGLSVVSPSEAASQTRLKMLVYGEMGSGKSHLLGTAALVPELCPMLVIDIEGGAQPLRLFDPTGDRISVVRITSWRDLQKIYDDLWKGGHGYKTVALDSLSETQKSNMAAVLGMGAGAKVEFDALGSLPQFQDWYRNTESMRRAVRAFRDLSDMNIIFTALAKDEAHPRREGVFIKKPAFTKQFAGEVGAFFDAVFYLYSNEVGGVARRFIQTDKTDRIVAKCRQAGVPQIIEDPTMSLIYDMLVRNPPVVEMDETGRLKLPEGSGHGHGHGRSGAKVSGGTLRRMKKPN